MTVFSPGLRAKLREAELDEIDVQLVVERALTEDLAFGPDISTLATVPAARRATADVVARAAGVLAGLPIAQAVLETIGEGDLVVETPRVDGCAVMPGDVALTVRGPARPLLTAERSMLNLLTHLSGVATATRAWVEAIEGTGAVVRDTRKTIPGLRLLEKYAVRCGGGANHRFGLGDAALIKDNHIAAAGGITAAVECARRYTEDAALEVECDTLEQVREAMHAGVVLVLLDNMSVEDMRAAVSLGRAAGGVRFEASGGLTLSRARVVAETGVDFLAVGALTHSASALDLGLDFRLAPAGDDDCGSGRNSGMTD